MRASVVRDVLIWLKTTNERFEDIIISEDNIKQYPDDGSIHEQMQHTIHDNDGKKQNEDMAENNDHKQSIETDSEEELEFEDESTESFVPTSKTPLIRKALPKNYIYLFRK